MMTGNLLWMVRAFQEFRAMDGLYYASVMASYCVGLVVYRQWQLLHEQKKHDDGGRPVLVTVAGTVALLLGVADAFLGSSSFSSSIFLVKWLPACLLSMAFAMINGVGNDTAGQPTFVITGHLTKLTNGVVDDRQAHTSSSWWATWQRLRQQSGLVTNLSVLLGFMGGAIFANAVRQSKVFLRSSNSVTGEFTCIGILLGALFLWKHSLETVSSAGRDTAATSIIKNMPWFRRRLFFLRRSSSVVFSENEASTTSAPILTAWNGTEYFGEDGKDFMDSTFASDLIVNATTTVVTPLDLDLPLNATTVLEE
jgi:uncharacterized membrane protein YoaK (UPF0700 family)